MNLRLIGCNFRTAPLDLRERLAFDDAKHARAVTELAARFGCEVVLLSTCNRVELLVARGAGERPFDLGLAAEFLGEVHRVPAASVAPLLYEHEGAAAVRHLFRVTASLDSLVVGEGQIAGQVKQAFEAARNGGATGPLLNACSRTLCAPPSGCERRPASVRVTSASPVSPSIMCGRCSTISPTRPC